MTTYYGVPPGYPGYASGTTHTATTGVASNTVYSPSTWMGTNSGNITWNYAPVTPGYYIMKSPENRMPFKVYADGVLLTSGIFGSLADVAFCRNNKLIFRATALFNKSSISIEYKGKLYHYSINCTYNSYPECEENSTWIKAQLLSKVEV